MMVPVTIPTGMGGPTTGPSGTVAIVASPGAPEAPFGGLAPTVTLEDVELCRVGQWNASTGGIEITPEVLTELATASRDADADHVPIHAGHIDPRFPALSDGEPAMGWVQNVRVIGDRLVGDLANVPARLAAVIPKAYRRRSIEIAANVRRPNGTVRPLALHGLGLLGVEMPAVKGLGDVVARYSAPPPVAQGTTLLLSDESPSPNPGGSPVATRHTDERLRELLGLAGTADVSRLQAELGALPEAAQAAAIANAQQAQQQVAQQVGSGQSATVAPGQTGTPAAQPAVAAQPTASTAPAPQQQAAPPVQPPVVQTPAAHTPGAEQTQQPALAGAGALSAAPAGVVAQVAAPGQGAGVSAATGGVYLSAEQYQALTSVLENQNTERQEGVLMAALSTGRLAPGEVEGWRQNMREDEARTTALLQLLPPNRVPVQALGSVGQANLSAHDPAAQQAMSSFEASLGLDLNRQQTQQQAAVGAPAAQQIGA